MRKKSLAESAYKQLAPKERFIAVLEAISRQDEDEVERLGPFLPARGLEDRRPGLYRPAAPKPFAAACFNILWLGAAQDYRASICATECYFSAMRSWVKGYAQGANSAWERAGRKKVLFDVDGREPSAEELDEIGFAAAVDGFPEKYEKRHQELASEVKGIYEGFVRFCQTIGMEPEKLLAWYPPILRDIEDLRGLLENDEIKPDEELATRVFEALVTNWPGAVDRSYERPLRGSQPQHAAIGQ